MPKILNTRKEVRTEYSAGGVVFRRTSRGIEIAFLLDPFGKWTFAKGHIEKGESIKFAAIREVKEEMGVRFLSVVTPLGRIDWWFKEQRGSAYAPKGAMVHKFVYYFLMEAPTNTRLRAQKSELISAVRFVPISEALSLSSYKDVKPVLKKALAILKR
ncbi:MAG: NUDIX domain-containing protein [bacterium]|nr:NUDIX domain-containing protein [bacterium]